MAWHTRRRLLRDSSATHEGAAPRGCMRACHNRQYAREISPGFVPVSSNPVSPSMMSTTHPRQHQRQRQRRHPTSGGLTFRILVLKEILQNCALYRWLILYILFGVTATAAAVIQTQFRFAGSAPKFFPPNHHIQRAVDLQRYQFTTPYWVGVCVCLCLSVCACVWCGVQAVRHHEIASFCFLVCERVFIHPHTTHASGCARMQSDGECAHRIWDK